MTKNVQGAQELLRGLLGAQESRRGISSAGWWTEAGKGAPDAPLAMLNDAIVPAALAAMAYSNRSWALDAGAGLVDPMAWADDASLGEDYKGMARAMLVAKTCRALTASELGIDPARSGSSLVGGVWRSGEVASALACVRTREDGTRELHLSVRGTDFDKEPDPLVPAAAIALAGFQYVIGTFLSIDKHAKRFAPLAAAMEAYAANPANGISKIVVSGHSLGAAAAEKLGLGMAEGSVPVVVFGFGSPGRGEGLRAPVWALAHQLSILARGVAALSVEAASGLADWAGRLGGGGGPSMLPRFSEMARESARRLTQVADGILAPMMMEEIGGLLSARKRSNIVQFRHPNDPVPKLGSFLYATQGGVRDSEQAITFLRRLEGDGEMVAVEGFRAHQSHRYADSVVVMAKNALRARAGADGVVAMGRASPDCDGLRAMDRAVVDAGKLCLSLPAALLPATIASARAASVKALAARDASDPTIARLLNLPAPQLADKLALSRALRVAEALRAAERLGGEAPFAAIRKSGGGFGGAPSKASP